MFDADFWKEIWQTISRNRKRSIMTAIGVFWGIFLFVILLGAGLWFGRTAFSTLGDMSTNSAFFFPEQTSLPYKGMPAGRWWRFDDHDLPKLRREIPGIKYLAAMNWGGNRVFSYNDRKEQFYLMGYTAEYQYIFPQNYRWGRPINEVDERDRRKVCVLGPQVYDALFPDGENPLGKVIKMQDMYLTVVGVIGRSSMKVSIGSDSETTVSVPITLVKQLWNEGISVDGIALTAYDDYDIGEIQNKARRILADNHLVSPDDPKAFENFDFSAEVDRVGSLFDSINLLIWIVGLGTLLAGIVGVSNIMLVIVRERTQEIGIRRAIGAPPRSIIMQIISESFVLTFISGMLGLTCGVALLSVADTVVNSSPDSLGIPLQITFWQGIGSMLIIVVGSILAGLIPAGRALRIKAVDAIREE